MLFSSLDTLHARTSFGSKGLLFAVRRVSYVKSILQMVWLSWKRHILQQNTQNNIQEYNMAAADKIPRRCTEHVFFLRFQ